MTTTSISSEFHVDLMEDLELQIGSAAAWKRIKKQLIQAASELNTDLNPAVGLLDEILSDADLTRTMLPNVMVRQIYRNVIFIPGMTAPAVALATYHNKQYTTWMANKLAFRKLILKAIGAGYVQRFANTDPLRLGLLRMDNLLICEQMDVWCTINDRDISVLQDILRQSFIWNLSRQGLMDHIASLREVHSDLEAANAPVNDNDKRYFFTAQMNSSPLLAQAVEKYLDTAAMPTAGGGIPPPPSFEAMTTYITTFISIRPPQDRAKAGDYVASVVGQNAEMASLREEIRLLKQQVRAGGEGRASGRGRFDRGGGRGNKQGGRGGGGRGAPAASAPQRDRPKNSCYCYVHGFGQHHTLNECSIVQGDPSSYSKAMLNATGPHSVPGHTGSTKRQLE